MTLGLVVTDEWIGTFFSVFVFIISCFTSKFFLKEIMIGLQYHRDSTLSSGEYAGNEKGKWKAFNLIIFVSQVISQYVYFSIWLYTHPVNVKIDLSRGRVSLT